ncbi:MAG: hypothetical protein IJN65_05820 [Clostridia bacterium]|nr:hypothetical protein [Clostridia bacterium]
MSENDKSATKADVGLSTESAEKTSAKRKNTSQKSAKKADEGLSTESAEKTSAKRKNTSQKSAKAKALEELIKFWSEIIDDTDIDIRQRIKASELKAKAAGIFCDSTDENLPDSTDSVVFFGEGDLLE